MKIWKCIACGFIYDEAPGLSEDGIAPRTRWEDIPEDWTCRIAARQSRVTSAIGDGMQIQHLRGRTPIEF